MLKQLFLFGQEIFIDAIMLLRESLVTHAFVEPGKVEVIVGLLTIEFDRFLESSDGVLGVALHRIHATECVIKDGFTRIQLDRLTCRFHCVFRIVEIHERSTQPMMEMGVIGIKFNALLKDLNRLSVFLLRH